MFWTYPPLGLNGLRTTGPWYKKMLNLGFNEPLLLAWHELPTSFWWSGDSRLDRVWLTTDFHSLSSTTENNWYLVTVKYILLNTFFRHCHICDFVDCYMFWQALLTNFCNFPKNQKASAIKILVFHRSYHVDLIFSKHLIAVRFGG